MRPTVHAGDVKVEHIGIVDGRKAQFGFAFMVCRGKGNQLFAFEEAALEVIDAFTVFVFHLDGDAVGTHDEDSVALNFRRERLVEPGV